MDRFDVAVVGAGPAGASAAAVLATAGLAVALVDKARFPRDKLCGGLLSQRCMRAIRTSFGDSGGVPIDVTAAGAAVYDRHRLLVRVGDYKAMHFTSRRRFDAYLVAHAASSGAVVLEGKAVTAVDFDGGAVSLADGRVLRTTFVVGADGAASRIRKLLGIAIDRRGFAVGLEAEVPKFTVAREVVDPEIYFGYAEWGYGWVFPKRDTLTVGVGGLAVANADMRARFSEFAVAALGRVPAEPLCGSPIPFGNFVATPGRASTLLVGDAAGLVEPLTGEGIAFAIQSGFLAAEAILAAVRCNAPRRALELYAAGYRSITRSFDDVRLLRNLVFSRHTRPVFLRALTTNERLVTRHMDVLAGDADYRDYARFALRETLTHLPQIVAAAVAHATSAPCVSHHRGGSPRR